jgi:flagellar biosynthesis/type III secretory pathway chaperone
MNEQAMNGLYGRNGMNEGNGLGEMLTVNQRCIAQCQTMLEFEQEKRQALLSDDLDRLESMIQAQQAAIMKLESLEKQRLEAQEKAGYHNLTADGILELLEDGPEKAALSRQVEELRQTLDDVRYQNNRALEIARANLQIVNTLATGQEQKTGQQGVYRKGQTASNWQGGSSFDKKM